MLSLLVQHLARKCKRSGKRVTADGGRKHISAGMADVKVGGRGGVEFEDWLAESSQSRRVSSAEFGRLEIEVVSGQVVVVSMSQ